MSCVAEPAVSMHQSKITAVDGYPITLAAGNTNDLYDSGCNSSSGICQLVGDSGGSTLTGLDSSNWNHGNLLWLRNIGSYPITIAHDSGSSSATDRLQLTAGRDIKLAPGRTLPMFAAEDWDNYVFGNFKALESNAIYGVEAVATPTRSFGSTFTPHAYRPVLGHWSVRIATTVSLSGGAVGRVELRSDSASPPTTVRGICPGGIAGTAVLGLSLTSTTGCELSYLVPPGDNVVLATVNESGTPTYTLAGSVEQQL